MNPYDRLENEVLLTSMEIEVSVSLNEYNEPEVWLDGKKDITDVLSPGELYMLKTLICDALQEREQDEQADYGDHLYEQEKDRRLDS